MPNEPPCALLISYDGLLEPLGHSQILPYVRGLAASGAALTLLTFEKPADLRVPGRVQALQAELRGRGIRWVVCRYHKRPRLLATALDLTTGLWRTWRILRTRQVYLVHARSFVPAIIAWLMKRWCGVRFLFDTKGFWVDERVDVGFWSRRSASYRLAKWLEQRFLEEADEIVTLTDSARRIVETWPGLRGPRVSVIPTCVDLDRFSPPPRRAPPDGAPVFAYVGSAGTSYRLDALYQFLRHAVSQFPQARLLVLTRQQEQATAALQASGLSAAVVTVRAADPSEVPGCLANAHVGLAFYQPGPVRRGTCPTKIGEYLATGLPVIVNAGVGDVEEVIGGNRVGVIVADFSSAAYRKAVAELEGLWADPALAARCRNVAERVFSLAQGVDRYRIAYERLARSASAVRAGGGG